VSGRSAGGRRPAVAGRGVRYGFSGSRTLGPDEERVVEDVLADLEGAEFTTGGCVGVDAQVGFNLWSAWPDALHRVVVPDDHSRVEAWWASRGVLEAGPNVVVELEQMPPGSSYRDRNRRIVGHSDVLVAFPAWPEDDPRSARSGTWQTVRLARRAGVDTRVFVLSDRTAGTLRR